MPGLSLGQNPDVGEERQRRTGNSHLVRAGTPVDSVDPGGWLASPGKGSVAQSPTSNETKKRRGLVGGRCWSGEEES